ncbi:putative P-type Cu(2+) transporter [Helianthus annuus]|nr:putative P-type Cu(2+) transporter [Helianthus annuus]
MGSKLLSLACIRGTGAGDGYSVGLLGRPHYPSMPKYPKGVVVEVEEETEGRVLLSVSGMSCSACAGSVEKAVKRLPGIKEAVVDVLNNRAQVLFYPNFVNVSFVDCCANRLIFVSYSCLIRFRARLIFVVVEWFRHLPLNMVEHYTDS